MHVGEVFRYQRLSEARRLIDAGNTLPTFTDGHANFLEVTLGSERAPFPVAHLHYRFHRGRHQGVKVAAKRGQKFT